MQNLTLQIDKATFLKILNGEQKEEHRNIYPYTSSYYVHYMRGDERKKYFVDCFDGDADAMWAWLTGAEVDEETAKWMDTIYIEPRDYTQITFINGRRKDAPRMIIEVLESEVQDIPGKDGGIQTGMWDDKEHPVQCMCYTLGKVLQTENLSKLGL